MTGFVTFATSVYLSTLNLDSGSSTSQINLKYFLQWSDECLNRTIPAQSSGFSEHLNTTGNSLELRVRLHYVRVQTCQMSAVSTKLKPGNKVPVIFTNVIATK